MQVKESEEREQNKAIKCEGKTNKETTKRGKENVEAAKSKEDVKGEQRKGKVR